MTGTAAALLATELLGAVGNLAAILRLGVAVTLVGEILDDVEIDDVVVRGHSEYVLRENHLLSGCRSVNFQNFQFHTLSLHNYIRTLCSGNGALDYEKVVLRDHLDHLEVEDLHPFISHVSCHAHSGEYAGRP